MAISIAIIMTIILGNKTYYEDTMATYNGLLCEDYYRTSFPGLCGTRSYETKFLAFSTDNGLQYNKYDNLQISLVLGHAQCMSLYPSNKCT